MRRWFAAAIVPVTVASVAVTKQSSAPENPAELFWSWITVNPARKFLQTSSIAACQDDGPGLLRRELFH